MKTIFRSFAVVLLLAVTALFVPAQTPAAVAPANELSITVQLVRVNPHFQRSDFKFNRGVDQVGPVVGLTHFLSEDGTLGLTAEVGAAFKSRNTEDSSLVTALCGLTIKRRHGFLQPNIRGLAGLGRLAATSNQLSTKYDKSTTGFAFDFGGGIDVKLSKHFRVRAVQVDFLGTRILGQMTKYARAQSGIVLAF